MGVLEVVLFHVILVWRGQRLGGSAEMLWRRVLSCEGACGNSFLILVWWFFLFFLGWRFGVRVLSSEW